MRCSAYEQERRNAFRADSVVLLALRFQDSNMKRFHEQVVTRKSAEANANDTSMTSPDASSAIFSTRRALLAALGVACVGSVSLAGSAFARSTDSSSRTHTTIELMSGGRTRRSLLFVPARRDEKTAWPLVIMLHGMGGTSRNAMEETDWSAKAEAEGFIVAYPDATRANESKPPNFRRNPQAWNDGSGRFHAGEMKVDDVAFIKALIAKLSNDYAIDAKRIFVAGFSNGASMTFRIGAALSAQVAAIAPNAGACWSASLRLARGVPVCYITGTADPLNPIDGGVPKLAISRKEQDGQAKPTVQESIDKWVKANGCKPLPVRDDTKDGVRVRAYTNGPDGPNAHGGATVEFTTVEGLGHHWAGGKSQTPEFMVGKNTKKLSATDVAWTFFRAHPMT
jgi:polyhydroxybutyrate depolymerase